jgi:hypothetical protein
MTTAMDKWPAAAGLVAVAAAGHTHSSTPPRPALRAAGKAFASDTRSEVANMWKMHRRRGQLMVFCCGSGSLEAA